MRPAGPISRTNAAGYDHPELIRMIDTSDASQVHEFGQMWNELGNEIMDFGASLQRTATSSEAIWVGQAGDTARTTLSKLAAWCHDTGQGAQHMGATVRTQAEAAQTAKRTMPEPVPYDPAEYQARLNSTINPIEWVRTIGDAREQADRQEAAYAEARRVIETYSASLCDTNTMMPAFTPPPAFGDRDTGPVPGGPMPGGGAGEVVPSVSGAGGGAAGGVPSIGGGIPPNALGTGVGGPGSGGAPPLSTPGQSVSTTLGQSVPYAPGALGGGPAGGSVGGPGGSILLPSTAAGIGAAEPGGRGSSAGGKRGGGAGGGFGPRGSGASNALGRGGVGSAGAAESATGAGRGVAGLAGHGPRVSPGAGSALPPMVGGGRGQGAEDTEHRRPSYLVETEDIWGDGRRVAPPVIGEDPPEYYR